MMDLRFPNKKVLLHENLPKSVISGFWPSQLDLIMSMHAQVSFVISELPFRPSLYKEHQSNIHNIRQVIDFKL